MGLQEAIDELDKKLEAEESEVEVAEGASLDDAPEPEVDEPEPPAATSTEAPAKVELAAPSAAPTPQDWYKLREETRKREALEAQLEELKKAPASTAPDPEEDPVGRVQHDLGATRAELQELKQWKENQEAERQRIAVVEAAFEELSGYEKEAAQALPDYTDAANYAKSLIAASIKLLEPDIAPRELAERTIHQYATVASRALRAGKHPGQAIYEFATGAGYKKADATSVATTEKARPKLTTVAANKAKSSGMGGAGGGAKPETGVSEFLKMSNAERMKLSESDWERLENGE